MSRLIDADKLKETLLKFNYTTAHNQIFRYIDEQPTAFDTEKVVKQLKSLSNAEADYYYAKSNDVIDREDAIDIVEKGGVD